MGYPIFHSQYTAAQIEASIGKTPRIKSSTRTWEIWDIATSAYVDTGVSIDTQLYVDPTLTESGYAADAKVTGDKIGELKSAITQYYDNGFHIKELYINEAGQQAGIATLHNVYSGPTNYYLLFSNAEKNAYKGRTVGTARNDGIIEIRNTNGGGTLVGDTVFGYVVVDWDNISTVDQLSSLTDNAYNLDVSPSIKASLQKNEIESVVQDVNGVYGGYGFVNLEGTFLNLSNTDNIWFMYDEEIPSKINQIRYKAKAGTVYFYKVTYVEGASSLTYSQITSVANASYEEGTIKTVQFADVSIGENDFIGVNGAFYYNTSATHYCRYYNISTGDIGNKAGQVMAFNPEYTDSINGRVLALDEKPIDLSRIGEVVLYDANLTSSNSDLVGTQNFDTFGLIVSSQIVLNKYYSVADRTLRLVCKFSLDTVASIGTATLSGSTYSPSTVFTIDVGNGTVQDNNLLAQNSSILNGTDVFLVSITKHYQNQVVELRNLITGETEEHIFTFNGTGGAGTGAVGLKVDTGMQYDYYYMGLSSGSSYSVSKIQVVCAKCDLLIYGDSITEPESYYPKDVFDTAWTQLVIKKMNKRAVTSGRGGTSVSAIFARIANELPFIKPKYCMVTIGTNGGATVSNLTTLVQYIKSQGATPILNHIPCGDNNGDTTYFVAVNGYVDAVRTAENVKGCNFDISTSVGRNGTTLDTSMMWDEDYGVSEYFHHPNVKGSAAMFAQLLIDVPEIFE